MDMQEVRKTARERMKGFCAVCRVCDGKVCPSQVPGMGGSGTGAAFRNNVSALERIQLTMRLIHDVTKPDTSTTLLGMDLQLPVIAAPVGGVSFNMGGALTEAQYVQAIISGCKARGIVGCTGDGAGPQMYETGIAAIEAEKSWGIPFVKPWAGEELTRKIDLAAQAGCKVIGMDIDAAGLITLAQMGRPVGPKSPQELAKVIARMHSLGMQCILKGLMSVDDVRLARACGCDAIVVSNHGGRALDHTPGTADVLPAIAAAARGMTVLVDGGIRTGVDILKMLALGADGVLLGRPFIIAAMGGEAEGVQLFIDTLRNQLTQALILTGCASVREASSALLHKA